MKMMLCVPVDVEVTSTRRSEIRQALKRRLIDLARAEKDPGAFLREVVDRDEFLVRAPEQPKVE